MTSANLKGFETRAHEVEAFRSMTAGYLPLKFAYSGSAAETHDRLARSEGYQRVVGSAIDDVAALRAMLAPEGIPLQWADLGPGNGVHTLAMGAALADDASRGRRYLGLDFSRRLMRRAETTLAVSNVTDRAFGEWDFENGPTDAVTKWRSAAPVLWTLNGITLCNVEDPVEVIRNIALSAERPDIVFATIAVADGRDDGQARVAEYDTDVFRAAVLEPLLMAGIAREAGVLELSYAAQEPAVIGLFRFTQGYKLTCHGDAHVFQAGDVIRCFVSRRFTRRQIDALVAASGVPLRGRMKDQNSPRERLLFDV